jgi:hypothetical protein
MRVVEYNRDDRLGQGYKSVNKKADTVTSICFLLKIKINLLRASYLLLIIILD